LRMERHSDGFNFAGHGEGFVDEGGKFGDNSSPPVLVSSCVSDGCASTRSVRMLGVSGGSSSTPGGRGMTRRVCVMLIDGGAVPAAFFTMFE
jgi:hypothetical protein